MKQNAKKGRAAARHRPVPAHNGNFWVPGVTLRTRAGVQVASNRLTGTATITAVTLASLQSFSLIWPRTCR